MSTLPRYSFPLPAPDQGGGFGGPVIPSTLTPVCPLLHTGPPQQRDLVPSQQVLSVAGISVDGKYAWASKGGTVQAFSVASGEVFSIVSLAPLQAIDDIVDPRKQGPRRAYPRRKRVGHRHHLPPPLLRHCRHHNPARSDRHGPHPGTIRALRDPRSPSAPAPAASSLSTSASSPTHTAATRLGPTAPRASPSWSSPRQMLRAPTSLSPSVSLSTKFEGPDDLHTIGITFTHLSPSSSSLSPLSPPLCVHFLFCSLLQAPLGVQVSRPTGLPSLSSSAPRTCGTETVSFLRLASSMVEWCTGRATLSCPCLTSAPLRRFKDQ